MDLAALFLGPQNGPIWGVLTLSFHDRLDLVGCARALVAATWRVSRVNILAAACLKHLRARLHNAVRGQVELQL